MPLLQHADTTLHFERQGQGPTLTICGGLGDSHRNWQLLIQKLAQDFDVLYVQNRGAGQSSRPTQAYSMQTMADDIKAILIDQNITTTHLLGFSMGGRVAQQFALTHAQFLQSLILISTAPSWYAPHPPSDAVLQHLLQFDGSDEGFAKTYEILYSPEYRAKSTARAFVKFRKADPFPQSVLDYQLQLQAILDFDVSAQVSQILAPTLVLAGDQDALTPYANALFLHKHLPNSQVKIYESTGHLLQFEKQKDFLHDVTQFIKGNP